MRYCNSIEGVFKLLSICIIPQLISCENDGPVPVNACFEIFPKYPHQFRSIEVSTGQVDSLYVFKNCSDSSQVAYLWDFGDGNTSLAKSPAHAYSQPGTYEVTLSVFMDNHFKESAKRFFEVIVGQKAFKVDELTHGLSVAPAKESGFYLLGCSGKATTITDWFLAKFNSELLLEWKKPLWPAISINVTEDGSILVSGRNGVLDKFRVTKLSPEGDIIWDKEYSEASSAGNNYTTKLSTGSFVTLGGTLDYPNNTSYTTVVGLTASGDFEWKKDFINNADPGLSYRGAIKISEHEGGLVLAVSLLYKLRLIKLDFNGNVVWEVQHNIPASSDWGITLNVFSNKIYVGGRNSNEITEFDHEGDFLRTLDLGGDGFGHILQDFLVADNNLYFVADYSWNQISYGIVSLGSGNVWTNQFENHWTEAHQSGSWEGRGSSVIQLPSGEMLFMGNRRDKHDYMFTSVFLAKTDKEGNIR